MAILNSILGIVFIFLVAFLFSNNKKKINWRTIIIGFVIQFAFAFAVLKWSVGKYVLSKIALGVQSVISYANEGIKFLFGSLTNDGSIFAVNVLGVIIFISAVVSVLYYLGIMQFIIKIIGGALSKLLGTSKLETISASANIFLGQTEAPLLIKPYVEKLTESELFTVMVGGLASVSGSILVGYSLLGIPIEYLVSASFMSAPAGLIMSKIIIPEVKQAKVNEEIEMVKDDSANVVDAAAKGAVDGLGLVLNIAAILLAFVALIALINGIIGWIGVIFGISNLSLQSLLGYIFAPVATIIGVPMKESVTVGSLIGQKLVLNEFVAFTSLSPIMGTLSAKATAIATFSLCGFANISSIAILIGGIGGMAPSRKKDIARLGWKAIMAGTLANLLSATIAGLLLTI
ncbi:NupC/NupG family nucleoside CNT transporter [Clostridium celatum]|uniref:Nucleoside permease n=1 Tax=Clostridium celatum DSM 1785 TaxID=545697 RepID=L1Q920_9CLOT|nr:NupC/NupG family nucleoside CNT transporter [Clostridium celatum]EKY24401.1 nucleoside transporter, NupC family [Clostridium celatum DSM 1785]MCE9655003.1 NupC/NupG family nucleoside CNT transporter [Clostridium celatum]MDU2266064.1 NupC/NupG family nucleoside CNT transporter [Clostridium celatum]MDU3721662.1 NupC/NupG family nucleoside CNT transporter [Clostridium celatum]MDU6296364.1 NupC/NupG family nucleoside CNT transporter [Clostridium celatum]